MKALASIPRRLIRVGLFLLFLVVSVSVGFSWHSDASQDRRSTLPTIAVPLYVNAWTTQPAQQVNVSVTMASNALGAAHTFAEVTLVPSSKTTSVVLTASMPSTDCVGGSAVPPSGLPKAGIGVLPYGYTAPQGDGVFCSFAVSGDSVTNDGEVVQAKLPVIQRVAITLRTPSTAIGLAGHVEANGVAYQFAQQVAASETVFGLGTKITQNDDDLVTNFPSSGTTEGDLFTWQGGSNLAPEIRAVSRDLEDARENDEFRSGIAFAIAAAAAVALAQEIPDRQEPAEPAPAPQTAEPPAAGLR